MHPVLRSLAAGTLAVACVAAIPVVAHAGAASKRCEITFRVSGDGSLGGLELAVDYSKAAGEFPGGGQLVDCDVLPEGIYASSNNDTEAQILRFGMVSASGAPLPDDFWRCTFETNETPVAGDFSFTVEDAVDPDSAEVEVEPSVSGIVCSDAGDCGNGVIEIGEECDDGSATVPCDASCKLTRNSQRCNVTFRVTGAQSIGGVQFDVDYSSAQGEFVGSGQSVACSGALSSGFSIADDRDVDSELRLAMISAASITLPVELWGCSFLTNAVPLDVDDFDFTNVKATNKKLEPVAVEVAAFTTSCIYGPYCGDGNVDPEETCDDGNLSSNDACTTACQPAVCGDGFIRFGVEQCDDGNSTTGDCCANNCTNESAATVCRAAAGVCDLPENCTGSTGSCPVDSKRNGTICRATSGECDIVETCNGTASACPANVFKAEGFACTTDNNVCTDDECNGIGACVHPSNTVACNDGLFCNGTDTCSGGTCSIHAGDPCQGPDGDIDCTETCSESSDNCSAIDPNGSTCNDGSSATSPDQCLDGVCVGGTDEPDCGDADENGAISSTDALRALRKAVGQNVSCPVYVCDTDNNGNIQTSDAQRILRRAVGQNVNLVCPSAN